MTILVWIGIALCISQSAIFSGLNLAFFSITRLRLEIEAEINPKGAAAKILTMRDDSNFLLTTILFGNVGINVLLTLLSDSVLAGVGAFIFSTFAITLFGEIAPQAYFSRNALKMASMLTPLIKIYELILYPVAKPSAMLLDKWLGKESIQYFRENNIKMLIRKHIDETDNEIDLTEGIGAINFLSIDDVKVADEGENIHPQSIITIPFNEDYPMFPAFTSSPGDPFLMTIHKSREKWVVIIDQNQKPRLILNADDFLREVLFSDSKIKVETFCHTPIIVEDTETNIGWLIKRLKNNQTLNQANPKTDDAPIDKDVVLFWGEKRKVITGADLLGSLLRGI
ncbi:MAG: DUF21 domain-containing protein [Deltaproteobacteria bacterium]|nr:DUF21 domain-containing protein [Deltaproteobacteria bacterium]